MKRIVISTEIKDFSGKPIKGEKDKNIIVKDILLNLVGSVKAANGAEAIQYMKIGTSLYEAKNEYVYEEADEALIHSAIDANVSNYNVVAISAALEAMKAAVAFKLELDKKKGKE